MKTQSGIEYKVDSPLILLCKAQDGQEFEIELSQDQLECVCCFPFGEPNREVEDSEIEEVINDWNS